MIGCNTNGGGGNLGSIDPRAATSPGRMLPTWRSASGHAAALALAAAALSNAAAPTLRRRWRRAVVEAATARWRAPRPAARSFAITPKRSVTVARQRAAHQHSRTRFPVPARHARVRDADRADAVRAPPRRLGQLVRQQQSQPRLALHPAGALPAPQPSLHCALPPKVAWQLRPLPPSQRDQPAVAAFQRGRHVSAYYRREQPRAVPRRVVRRAVCPAPVHQRAGLQRGAPRTAAAKRGQLHQQPPRGRRRDGIPGLAGCVVPADHPPDRAGRGALDRRLLPPRARAPAMDSKRRLGKDRPPFRLGPRPDLPGLS